MDYLTIVHHTGPYVELFKQICPEDEDNVYMATLLELDEKDLANTITMLENFTLEMQFTPESWILFTRSFPDAVLNLLTLDMHHMHVQLNKPELKTLVECYVLWYFLTKNYSTSSCDIFKILPDVDVILYPDFDEESLMLDDNDSNDSDSSDSNNSSDSQ